MLSVGIYMSETKTYWLYDIHKSIGVIIFAFAFVRIALRIKEGWPKPVGVVSAIQLFIAKLVHWGLIISTITYPISGMMMSGAGGHGISIFGLELVAENLDAAGKALPINESIASLGHEVHEILVWVLIPLIVLHILGAIKHHIIDKDETVTRMFTFR